MRDFFWDCLSIHVDFTCSFWGVVSDGDDHFVELRSDLDAACKSSVACISFISSSESVLLRAMHLVYFVGPLVSNDDTALSTSHSHTVVIVRDLEGLHTSLFISTVAVWVDSWNVASLHHI